jgi:hyperosmotically inducible protein
MSKSFHIAILATMLAGCAGAQHGPQRREDRSVTARVEARLAADPDASAFDVDVDTIDGVVTLRGEVPSESERASAESVTRYTPGVRVVRNLLVVKPQTVGDGAGQVLDDASIHAKVGARLLADPEVKRYQIDVDVEDGVVTLSGTVADAETIHAAEDVALHTSGVKRVINELQLAQAAQAAPVLENE